MKYKPVIAIALVAMFASLFTGTASAQSPRTRGPAGIRSGSSGAPALRAPVRSSISPSTRRDSGNRSSGYSGGSSRPSFNARPNSVPSGRNPSTGGRTRPSQGGTRPSGAMPGNAYGNSGGQNIMPFLDALTNGALSGNAHGSKGGQSMGSLLDALANGGVLGHGSPYYGNNRHREYSMPEAYRDAAIASSLVDLVGILVQSGQQPAAPAGRYIREKIVIVPEHYETYQVRVPPIYDSRTGQQIGGGYDETRTRLVPEVAEYRDIPVSPVP